MGDRLPNETDKAWQAFKDYLELGGGRRLTYLREKYLKEKEENKAVPTVSIKTIEKWSHYYNWAERAREWDVEQEKIRAEIVQENKIKRWKENLEDYQERCKKQSNLYSQICLKIATRVLAVLSENELTVDQALKAIHGMARLTEISQAVESNALGISQILASLADGKETEYDIKDGDNSILFAMEDYSEKELESIRAQITD